MAKLTYTAPQPGPTNIEPTSIELVTGRDPRDAGGIRVKLMTDTEERVVEWIPDVALVAWVNTADFSTKSLERYLLEWLVANRPEKYSGTVA